MSGELPAGWAPYSQPLWSAAPIEAVEYLLQREDGTTFVSDRSRATYMAPVPGVEPNEASELPYRMLTGFCIGWRVVQA